MFCVIFIADIYVSSIIDSLVFIAIGVPTFMYLSYKLKKYGKNELPKNIIDIGYIIIFSITIVAIIYIIYLIKKIKMLSITNSYTYPTFIETLTEFIILESKEYNKYHKNNTITRKV